MRITKNGKIATVVLLCLGTLSFILGGCGADQGSSQLKSSPLVVVKGVAATGMPIDGTVMLTDSSATPQTLTSRTGAGGEFSFNATLLTPPFTLMAEWTEESMTNRLYSSAEGPGTTNINPFSNAVYAAASLDTDQGASAIRSSSAKRANVKDTLRRKLKRLFALYDALQDPINDDYKADHTGLDALFDDVRISVSDGMVTVTNKKTGVVIFTAPVDDLESGTFHDGNMPGTPGQTDGAALYDSNCRSCHGSLATSEVRGASAAEIQSEIKKEKKMSGLSGLTALEIQAIATALGSSATPSPDPAPSDGDGAALYANYCSSCHGVLASSEVRGESAEEIKEEIEDEEEMSGLSHLTAAQIQAIAAVLGSSATPPPDPAPDPAPSDGATLYASYCASCHGPLATSSKRGATAASIQSAITGNVGSMGQFSTLTASDIQAIATALGATSTPSTCTYTYSAWGTCQSNNTQTRTVTSSTPSGCSGTPSLSQPCAYVTPACIYTYNAWGACQSNNTQTRTVASSSPTGCEGTPILSQSCTYTAPACTYTYTAWGTCQSNNTQTRTVTSTSPTGCSGTPVLSQSCTYTAPACTYTYTAWGTCQSNNTQTRTVTSTSPTGCSGTPVLSQSCTYVPPTPACGSCHAIPPSSGKHSRHVTQQGYSCATCHGTGYSSTTVNAATHQNGTVNMLNTLNFNASTRTCGSPGCHGSRTW